MRALGLGLLLSFAVVFSAGCGAPADGGSCDAASKGFVDCEIGGFKCQPGQYCGRNDVGAPLCTNGCLSDANCGCGQTCTTPAGQSVGVCSLPMKAPAGPSCGDGVCNGSETTKTCPADCVAPPPPPTNHCGDGVCSGSESEINCPADCPDVARCGRNCQSYDFFGCFAAGALQSCYDRCALATAAQELQFSNCAAISTTSCNVSCLGKLPQ